MHKNMQMGMMSDTEKDKRFERIKKLREAKEGKNKASLVVAALFGAAFPSILIDQVVGGAKKFIPSKRSPEEIVAELNAFYSVRPRPWRAHMNRRRNRAALVRRQAATAKRDKQRISA